MAFPHIEVRSSSTKVTVPATFVGASNFDYAQSTWPQGLPIESVLHVGAFAAIGGVPALLVPDNTKVAVIKACLCDPQINRTYADMAAHYGSTVILPTKKPSGSPHQYLKTVSPAVVTRRRVCRAAVAHSRR